MEYVAIIGSVALPAIAFLIIKWMVGVNITEEQEKDLDEMAKRFEKTKGGKS